MVHFKQSIQKDVAATALPILDSDRRRRTFEEIRERAAGRYSLDVDDWVQGSPLVLVELAEPYVGASETPIG